MRLVPKSQKVLRNASVLLAHSTTVGLLLTADGFERDAGPTSRRVVLFAREA